MKSNKILAFWNEGEKTVEGRGYEPYEAVRCNALIPAILNLIFLYLCIVTR